MWQNFPLMSILVPILFRRKILTNRALTPPKYFRRRCDIRDKMYFWENYRQKGMKLIGMGIVIETAEWNIAQIPLTLEQAKKEKSPKKDINWFKFAWVDGFDYYNKTHICNTLKLTEKQLDVKLYKEFEKETGKNAVWRNKITKNFLNWKSMVYPNFVDFFKNHKMKVKDFKMFVFKEFRNPSSIPSLLSKLKTI